MKKVVLYNPKAGRERDYYGTPLALLAVSRLLLEDGYEVKIINGNVDKDVETKIMEEVADCLAIGMTVMTGYQITDALRIAKLVKEKYKDKKIIFGGWHVSIMPEQSIKNQYIDIIVRGQGERTLYEVCETLRNNKDLKNIIGITFKHKNKVISNPDRPLEDINNFSLMPYHLLDIEKYLLNSEFGNRTAHMFTSQGCPFRCKFCAEPQIYKRRWVSLKAERVVEEIEGMVNKYKIDSLMIVDSNFFINEERVKNICKLLIKKKINIKLGQVNGRVDTVTNYKKATWELMKKAGFVNILVGAESGSQDILDFITKDIKAEQIIQMTKLCKKYGMTIVFSFFIGLPTKDINKEYKDTTIFIDRMMKISDKNTYYLLLYAPYPGNDLFDISVKMGFEPPNKLEEWVKIEQHGVKTPWQSKKYAERATMLTDYIFPILGHQLKTIVWHYEGFAKAFYEVNK